MFCMCAEADSVLQSPFWVTACGTACGVDNEAKNRIIRKQIYEVFYWPRLWWK